MQSTRVGTASLPRSPKAAPTRLSLFAALLAMAVALLHPSVHGQTSVQAGVLTAPSSSQPAQPSSAASAANSSNQEIGQLLQMATELKTAILKTNQDTLSIAVVRKAAAIEQLAHKVRTAGGAK